MPAVADAAAPSPAEAASALAAVPFAVAGDLTGPLSSNLSGLLGDVAGGTVAIPSDAASGVTVSGTGGEITIGIPFGDQAQAVQSGSPDVAVYTGTGSGASTAVSATTDGVRLGTVIADASAPTDYAYPITGPSGADVVLSADGSASIVDADGNTLATISAPLATDALGVAVPTSFSVVGNVLIQHVDHAGAAYPVVADPVVHGAGIFDPDLISSVKWVKTNASSKRFPTLKGWSLFVTPHTLCRAICIAPPERHAAWGQVKAAVRALKPNSPARPAGAPTVAALGQSMYDQFACHTIIGQPKFPTWNLDTYRPDASLAIEIATACNPPTGSFIGGIEGQL